MGRDRKQAIFFADVEDIGTILGLAHLIHKEDLYWPINGRIVLKTFNEVY